MRRRKIVLLWACAGPLAVGLPSGAAGRTLRLVCPTSPGSSPDTLARLLAKHLALVLGITVVVENAPGAGTTLGSAAVANAHADGATLLLSFSPTFSLAPIQYSSAHYDPVKSFVALGSFARISPFLVVHPSLAVRNFSDYLSLARTRPGGLEFAHAGTASVSLLLAELLRQQAQVQFLYVPYRNEAESRIDVLSGRVSTAVFWAPVAVPMVQAGRLTALAYAGATRHPLLPEVPTFTEVGAKDMDIGAWYGFFAPAGTPREVVARLNAAVAGMLTNQELDRKSTRLNSSHG